MTTLQLNAELLRELSIIAEDEGMLKKVLTFVKTLTVWHHRLDGHEFEQAPGLGEGQGSLVCCSP